MEPTQSEPEAGGRTAGESLQQRLVALSVTYAARDDARLAVAATWLADLDLVHTLLWENGLAQSPDPAADLAAVGEAIAASQAAHPVTGPATARDVAEGARRGLAAAFDPTLNELLEQRFSTLEHLDALPAPGPQDRAEALARRLEGQHPDTLMASLYTTGTECMAVADVMLVEGDRAGAIRQVQQADLTLFEGYLIAAALGAGDVGLASVDIRWDLVAAMEDEDPVWGDVPEDADLEAVVRRRRDRLASAVGWAELPVLEAALLPVPTPLPER